jgi:hypothetical protein
MPKHRPWILALLPAAVLLVLIAPFAQAKWPHDPSTNLRVGDGWDGVRTVSDGRAGAIVTWTDYVAGENRVFAQRLDAHGMQMWGAGGVPVGPDSGSSVGAAIASDGAGGAIIALYRARAGMRVLYAQHLNADGAKQWADSGVAVCPAVTSAQTYPSMVPDGYGGAVLAWTDDRNEIEADIYSQRILASGAIAWGSAGAGVCVAAGKQDAVQVVLDQDADAVDFVWEDWRSGTDSDIYAIRRNFYSNFWPPVKVCGAARNQQNPVIVSHGLGLATVAWQDYRGGSDWNVYAQRIDACNPSWTADGEALCTASGDQDQVRIAGDGSDGAIVAWVDGRDPLGEAVHAQRVDFAGAAQWASNGLALGAGAPIISMGSMVPDGAGGAIVGWSVCNGNDLRVGDVRAQRVSTSGITLWGTAGAAVSTAPSKQYAPDLAPDGAGGGVFVWSDSRGGGSTYAQHVDAWGKLGPQPVISAVRDVPNDQGGQVKLSWYASPLDSFPDYSIYNYLIFRSVPPQLAARALREGRAARVTAVDADRHPGRRAILTRGTGAAETAWEYVGTVTANHVPIYSYLAPTAGDSVEGSNPRTQFMVEARASSGWWFSDPDSGYSVDNLAPPAPAYFTARWAAGNARLHWPPCPAGDFSVFRLYRGTSLGFVPEPGNLLAFQADTGYVDPVGCGYFYKLTAVDVHGNEGRYVAVWPEGAGDVPDGPTPPALALSAPAPNPSRGSAAVRLALPRAARVSLVVLDQQGRRVRTLLSGEVASGERTVSWDGRDDGGRAAPSAVYFLRLETDGRTLTRRVALVR